MRLLVDTHVLLWALSSPAKLKRQVRQEIESPANEVFVSSASVWEISIKMALGKLSAPPDLLLQIAAASFEPLPIALQHADTAGSLPSHHKDPFDRMLIAQAQEEGLTVVTRDSRFKLYGVHVLAA